MQALQNAEQFSPCEADRFVLTFSFFFLDEKERVKQTYVNINEKKSINVLLPLFSPEAYQFKAGISINIVWKRKKVNRNIQVYITKY